MLRIAHKLGWALAALILLIALGSVVYVRRTLPQISGTARVAGLHAPVTVARDRFGVPHIFAADEHDAYVAQGYVTAQDRLWQMLLRRQAARGQLSEWLGQGAAMTDDVLRRQNLYTQELASPLSAEARAQYEAYASGVDACLNTCPEPIEVTFLKWQGRLGQIEPWSPADSLALEAMFDWAQAQSSDEELRREISIRVGANRVDDLWTAAQVPVAPVPPIDPALRQVLRLANLSFSGDDMEVFAPTLPTPWYVLTWRTQETTGLGAAWPGVPQVQNGAFIRRNVGRSSFPQRTAASVLVQHLLALPPEGWLQTRVHGMLRQWDGALDDPTDKLSDASAAVYQAWLWHLARATFQDELGSDLFSRYWATGLAPEALSRLLERSGDPWWDDQGTPQRETRDDILRCAYTEALDDLGRHYGDLHTIWEWDTMHTVTLRHPLGNTFVPGRWLNRTIKWKGLAPFDPVRPDDPLNPYAPLMISSLQMDERGFALAGGQSGHPFSPHYADLLPLWARGQLVALEHPSRPEELYESTDVLTLIP